MISEEAAVLLAAASVEAVASVEVAVLEDSAAVASVVEAQAEAGN